MCVYNVFVGYFDGHKAYEIQLSNLQNIVEKEKLKSTLLSYQLKDFQQAVAQLLPPNEKLQSNFGLQNLASALRTPASEESLDLSSAIFERGMKFFNSRNYEKAIEQFHNLIERYPLSKNEVEARFFSAESNFLKKDYKSCLEEIDIMVAQYPDNDLTGFILLRMGQISDQNNQPDEAKEIYKAAWKNFKNEKIRKQAFDLLQGVP
jgi:TolA-binding protein